MGIENYEKAAAKLVKGKTVKLKGELSYSALKRSAIVLNFSKLYEGDKPAVLAADLTKDIMTNRAAAEKKYDIRDGGDNELIVEGVLTEVYPSDFRVILAGHSP